MQPVGVLEKNELPICVGCGTQFDPPEEERLLNCRMCDEPRQFVPTSGQVWTSLSEMQGKYTNEWMQDEFDGRIWSVWTEPKFGIGQRAILLQTDYGNVLWDCIAYLDQATVNFVQAKGGLRAIVISHPHFYSTHLDWATAFDCPVYVAWDDIAWLNRNAPADKRILIHDTAEEILPGVTAVKVGGHFPGSLVLHWEKKLMIADTFVTVPSALHHHRRSPNTTSFSFMWSVPNMIPLPPSELYKMWITLKPFAFESTYGLFPHMVVRDTAVKGRVLESMKIQAKFETGHEEHAILKERWP